MALGIVFTLLAIMLVGNGVRARSRRGEPMIWYAAIWVAIIAALFAAAWLIGHHGANGLT